MDAATLVKAVAGRITTDYAQALMPGLNQALQQINATTPERSAMFIAQCAEESVCFKAREEYASGAAYEGRSDLGNTQPGDGVRFKGRSFIQITGRHNYTALSSWARSRGLVTTSTYFVDNPSVLASVQYAWVGPIWYWVVARPQLNALADARDLIGATKAVNGGLNGYDTRKFYWDHALPLGRALLPAGGDDVTPEQAQKLIDTAIAKAVAGRDATITSMIQNALKAVMTGSPHAHWNHKEHPDLVASNPDYGVFDRLRRLEDSVKALKR